MRREATVTAGRAKEDMRLFGAKDSESARRTPIGGHWQSAAAKTGSQVRSQRGTHLLNILRDEELRLWTGRRGWVMRFCWAEGMKRWEVDEEKPQQHSHCCELI